MQDLMNAMGGIGIIITIVSVGITLVVLFFVFRIVGNLQKGARANQQLLMTGEPAQATVMQLQDTGMLVNNNPMVQLVLDINSATHGSYQVAVRTLVPMIKLAQVQPGMSVGVKIDPTNKANVAVDLR